MYLLMKQKEDLASHQVSLRALFHAPLQAWEGVLLEEEGLKRGRGFVKYFQIVVLSTHNIKNREVGES